jgi:hypothetical protein
MTSIMKNLGDTDARVNMTMIVQWCEQDGELVGWPVVKTVLGHFQCIFVGK